MENAFSLIGSPPKVFHPRLAPLLGSLAIASPTGSAERPCGRDKDKGDICIELTPFLNKKIV